MLLLAAPTAAERVSPLLLPAALLALRPGQLSLPVKGGLISPCWEPIWKLQDGNLTWLDKVSRKEQESANFPAAVWSRHPQLPLLCFGKTQVSKSDPLSANASAGWGQAMLSEWLFLTSAGIHLDEPFPHANLKGRFYITLSKSAIPHGELWLGKGWTHVDSSWAAQAGLVSCVCTSDGFHHISTHSAPTSSEWSFFYHGKVVFIISRIDLSPNILLGNRGGKAGIRQGAGGGVHAHMQRETDTQSKLLHTKQGKNTNFHLRLGICCFGFTTPLSSLSSSN